MSRDQEHIVARRCAEALARAAGQRIERGRRAGFKVDYKGRNDPVTEIDRDVERFLRGELSELFPEDAILGEEFGGQQGDPPGSKRPRRLWLIDPIDGTTNFSQGVPIYCVSMALYEKDQAIVAAIYDPTRDELFSAQRGRGATLNGVAMKVSARDELSRAVLATGFPPLKQGDSYERVVERLGRIISVARGVRRFGSAALDMAYVAAGRLDGFWEYHLHPWDTAAGALLIEEAGGRVTTEDGSPHSPYAQSTVATNLHIHGQMIEALARHDIALGDPPGGAP